jgi:amidase
VIDTALWLDVTAGPAPGDAHTPPPPPSRFVEAATTPPPRLTVAWSVEPVRALAPPIVGESARVAVDTVVAALSGLGHSVVARTPEYGAVGNEIAPLYLRGILEHFEQVPRPDRLEARTRGFARLGRLVPDAMLRGALGRRVAHTERINRIFDEVDLLVTPATGMPPVPVGTWRGRGAVRTSIGMSRVYPFTAVWNYTGQPAATIPAGFTADGLPIGAMLIAPPNREDLLLSVAAQLELALGWSDHRPQER